MSKAKEWTEMHGKIIEEVKRGQEKLQAFRQETMRFTSAFGIDKILRPVAEVDRDGSLNIMQCSLSSEEAVRLGKWLIDTFGD